MQKNGAAMVALVAPLPSPCQTSPKDTTKAKFIKYFNDKSVLFNNQIITGLLLFRTHGCITLSDWRLHSLAKSTGQSFSDFKLYAAVKLL